MTELLTHPAALLTIGCTVALVASDLREWTVGRLIFKPLAALGFIVLAWSLGAPASSYGQWVIAGLALCAIGDLCLMWRREGVFLSGLVAFLLGHLLYCVAFLQRVEGLGGLWVSLLPVLVLLAFSLRWLLPHLEGVMKLAVPAYVLVIGSMVACAGLTWGHPHAVLAIAGAWGFAFSDLAVARDRFIRATPLNGLWGTPLYFGSQLLLAASAAAQWHA